MRRVRIVRVPTRPRERPELEVLRLDPRDPDILRAKVKGLARSTTPRGRWLDG